MELNIVHGPSRTSIPLFTLFHHETFFAAVFELIFPWFTHLRKKIEIRKKEEKWKKEISTRLIALKTNHKKLKNVNGKPIRFARAMH